MTHYVCNKDKNEGMQFNLIGDYVSVFMIVCYKIEGEN